MKLTLILMIFICLPVFAQEDLEKIIPQFEIKKDITFNNEKIRFCKNLLSNLKKRNIKFKKSINYESRIKFLEEKKYFGKCNPEKFIEYYQTTGTHKITETLFDLGSHTDLVSLYTAKKYRVFEGDIDHDNKKEFIVYGYSLHKEPDAGNYPYGFSDIKAINLESCSLDRSRQVDDIGSKYNKNSFVGVLTYNNKDYYYEGSINEKYGSYLKTYEPIYRKSSKDYFYGIQCLFRTNIPKN